MENLMSKEKRTIVKNGDVYCIKCGCFLGMTCDPFRPEYHDNCFPNKEE